MTTELALTVADADSLAFNLASLPLSDLVRASQILSDRTVDAGYGDVTRQLLAMNHELAMRVEGLQRLIGDMATEIEAIENDELADSRVKRALGYLAEGR